MKDVFRRAFAVTALLAVGCGDGTPMTPPELVSSSAPAHNLLPSGAVAVEGTIGPGALYGLYRPPVWNGILVLYAHGYEEPGTPRQLPTADPSILLVRNGLLELGFAVAMSSFSESGFALQDGEQRTHQLRGLFTSRLGQPSHTILMGHSLGGMVALKLAEKHPGVYDAALPICTFPGGSVLQFEYLANMRAVFDYFFPGVLPGGVYDVPAGLDFATQVVPAVTAAFATADPLLVAAFASVDQLQLQFSTPEELVTATLRALRYQIVGTRDLLQRTNSRIPVDNTGTVYTIGGIPHPGLNAGIERFSSAPNARNYLLRNYEPTGRLGIPVLMLHTTGDPDTPVFHLPVYEATVATAGRSDQLVQRIFDRFGHCTITPEEHVAALNDLATWMATGVKPLP
jgi:pimeloyl-ACP methyl ester carboxylesterase